MFTRAELEAAANMGSSKELNLHKPFTVQFSDDVTSESDQYFFRGAKKHYEHGAHFWLRCINWLEESWNGYRLLMAQRSPDPGHDHASLNTPSLMEVYTLCKNISPESFRATIEEYSLRLKHSSIPHSYHWEGQVQWAMQMSDEWYDQSFIAETEHEYLAFHWETSA